MSVATAEVNGTARMTANPPNSTPTTATREERDERREPDRPPDVGVDDVALELADDDEPEQGERGDVQGLRDADGEDEDRADERADHWHDLDQADERADEQPVVEADDVEAGRQHPARPPEQRRGWSPSESGSIAIAYLLTSGFIRTKSPLVEVASMKSARSAREMRGLLSRRDRSRVVAAGVWAVGEDDRATDERPGEAALSTR